MTREQAENMIAEHLKQIAQIMEKYYPQDGYLSAAILLREGYIHFNNSDWEHAAGKINKTLLREGGEWRDAKHSAGNPDVQSEE